MRRRPPAATAAASSTPQQQQRSGGPKTKDSKQQQGGGPLSPLLRHWRIISLVVGVGVFALSHHWEYWGKPASLGASLKRALWAGGLVLVGCVRMD